MENLFVFIWQEWIMVAALLFAVYFLINHESAKGGVKLSPQQVVNAINGGEAVIVDVRDSKEYDTGHLVDAIHIPFNKVNDNLQLLEKHREKQIIIVDKMGQQSGAIVKKLTGEGFNAARMNNGISEWQHDGLPLVK